MAASSGGRSARMRREANAHRRPKPTPNAVPAQTTATTEPWGMQTASAATDSATVAAPSRIARPCTRTGQFAAASAATVQPIDSVATT